MQMNELAARLAITHHSTVVFVLEKVSQKDVLYLSNDLREALAAYSGNIASNRGCEELCVVKSNGAQVRVVLSNVMRLAQDIDGFHPDTPVFTFTRTGIYESTAR